jgi:hypothetical protein
MKTSEKAPTIAIYTTKGQDRGVRWPEEWNVKRGNLTKALRDRPRPEVVVMSFSKPPTEIEMKKVARRIAPILDEAAGNLIVVCAGRNKSAFNRQTLVGWFNAFDAPERVTFTTNWDSVLPEAMEAVARGAVLRARTPAPATRRSVLDEVAGVIEAGDDLRTATGRLSAEPIAELFGISKSELARLLGRTPQALWKTPDAEAIQLELGYFEKAARLRLMLKDSTRFRKWLRTPNPSLEGKAPLDLIREKRWQVLADFVDDILAGTPA